MLIRVLLWIGGAVMVATAQGAADATDPGSEMDSTGGVSSSSSPVCSVYIAPSTIPGAGLGVYVSEPLAEGDIVETGSMCIPMVDIEDYNRWNSRENPFENYHWNAADFGMLLESKRNMDVMCFGIASAANSFYPLVNAEATHITYDDGEQLHRSKDPGVGAFTPYRNLTSYAVRDIPAGGEVFVDYGDNWFRGRPQFNTIPKPSEYDIAVQILVNFTSLPIPPTAPVSIWEDLHHLILSIRTGTWETSLLNAIPESIEIIHKVVQAGEFSAMYQPTAIRSIPWLQENGRCIDAIRVAASTIPQAGQGAFSTRSFDEGSIVATTPLIHVPDRAILNIYDLPLVPWQRYVLQYLHEHNILSYHTLHRWIRYPLVKRSQLMLNYCYGHRASTIVLCPYLHGVSAINHDPKRANLKLRWAQNFTIVHHPELVESGTISDLVSILKPSLAFEYVATRPIVEGEELFLDYGDEWDDAWTDHVEEVFRPSKQFDHYASAAELNEIYKNAMIYTDEEEQEKERYPNNIIFRCHRNVLRQHRARTSSANNIPSNELFDWTMDHPGFPCYILERNQTDDGDFLYKIEVGIMYKKNEEWVVIEDIPRAAVRFFDIPYSTDMHLSFAFRHDIRIPDDIFPEKWRNRERNRIPFEIRLLGMLLATFSGFYWLFSFLMDRLEAAISKEKLD